MQPFQNPNDASDKFDWDWLAGLKVFTHGHTAQSHPISSPLSLSKSKLKFEPRNEKTGFLHICENKEADQLRGNREADHRLCFRYIDSTIPLLRKSEISSL